MPKLMTPRLTKVRWPGKHRQVDVIVGDRSGEPLVHYGDVCYVLPASFRAPIPTDRVLMRHGQCFVRASDLRRQTRTDTQGTDVRKMLARFLDHLESQYPTGVRS